MKGTSDAIKYTLAALGGFVNGLSAGFLWVGIGSYIHIVCHHFKVIAQKGYYYGLFSTIYTWNTIIGAVIQTFGLLLMTFNLYFLLTSLIAVASFFYALIFIKNIRARNHQAETISSES